MHIAKLIIDRGANVNIETKSGTPLHAAVRANSGKILFNLFHPFSFQNYERSEI